MSVLSRVREIASAMRATRFPSPPKRKYDLIGEQMARPFGESIGRGRIRDGGVIDDEDDDDTRAHS